MESCIVLCGTAVTLCSVFCFKNYLSNVIPLLLQTWMFREPILAMHNHLLILSFLLSPNHSSFMYTFVLVVRLLRLLHNIQLLEINVFVSVPVPSTPLCMQDKLYIILKPMFRTQRRRISYWMISRLGHLKFASFLCLFWLWVVFKILDWYVGQVADWLRIISKAPKRNFS